MFKGLLYQFAKRQKIIPIDKDYANWLCIFDEYIQEKRLFNIERDLEDLCDKVFDYAIANDLKETKELINLIRWSNFVKRRNIDIEYIDNKDRETRETIKKAKEECVIAIDRPLNKYMFVDEIEQKKRKETYIYGCDTLALAFDDVKDGLNDLEVKINKFKRTAKKDILYVFENESDETLLDGLAEKINNSIVKTIGTLIESYSMLNSKISGQKTYDNDLKNKLKEITKEIN